MADGRDRVGGWLGVLTFLGGIALLLITFKMAYDLFSIPPDQVLKLKPGQELNVNDTGQAAFVLLFRMLMLLVMSIVGSVIANRGIKLYATRPVKVEPLKETETSTAA